jgi:plasmid stabilization system protein ParE
VRRAWRLTPLAESSLADIAAWTLRTFGPVQAEAYERDLIARCRAIARGIAPSQDCSVLVEGADDLRFIRAGRHFVIFTEIGNEIVILDFVHGRTDLPGASPRCAGHPSLHAIRYPRGRTGWAAR